MSPVKSVNTCQGVEMKGFFFSWSNIDIMASGILHTINIESSHSECNYVTTRNGWLSSRILSNSRKI